MKILVNDHVLVIEALCCGVESILMGPFSESELELLCLKINLGRMFLMDDLPLADPFSLEGLGVGRKLTLLGVGVGVDGMFM